MSTLNRREKLTLRVEHTASRSAEHGTTIADMYKLLHIAEKDYRQRFGIPDDKAISDDALRVDHDDEYTVVYYEAPLNPDILQQRAQ